MIEISAIKEYLLHWLIVSLSLLATAVILPGFKVRGPITALFSVLVIGFANLFIKPLLLFLTLPINILTFGFFTIVVNAITLRISAALMPGFAIESWWAAIFGSVLVSVITSGAYWLMMN